MSDLVEFLLARIAEDETAVDTIDEWRATDSARGPGWGRIDGCLLCDHYFFDGDEPTCEDAAWDHMEAVHRRTRILAECEAKRRIVELHSTDDHSCPGEWLAWIGVRNNEYIGEQYEVRLCPTLRALAAVYADHPDYDEAWRP